MKTYAVTIDRSASIMLTYHISAVNESAAEDVVEQAIRDNNISKLGTPAKETFADDEESCWEVLDVVEAV